MFSTFTKRGGGTLAVRAEDIRTLDDVQVMNAAAEEGDTPAECRLAWVIGDQIHDRIIQGTAAENLARIAKEELEAALQVDAIRQKQAQGYPVPSIVRGRR